MTRDRRRTTFREVFEQGRNDAARRLFIKARTASRLAKVSKRGRAALYRVKARCLYHALRVAPDLFRRRPDRLGSSILETIYLSKRVSLHTSGMWLQEAMELSA